MRPPNYDLRSSRILRSE